VRRVLDGVADDVVERHEDLVLIALECRQFRRQIENQHLQFGGGLRAVVLLDLIHDLFEMDIIDVETEGAGFDLRNRRSLASSSAGGVGGRSGYVSHRE